mgnify:CR=1 FL=1
MKTPTRIVISIEGGVVSGVLCDGPVQVLILDYDVEGAMPDSVTQVPQCTEPTSKSHCEPAYLFRRSPEPDPVRVQQLFNL